MYLVGRPLGWPLSELSSYCLAPASLHIHTSLYTAFIFQFIHYTDYYYFQIFHYTDYCYLDIFSILTFLGDQQQQHYQFYRSMVVVCCGGGGGNASNSKVHLQQQPVVVTRQIWCRFSLSECL